MSESENTLSLQENHDKKDEPQENSNLVEELNTSTEPEGSKTETNKDETKTQDNEQTITTEQQDIFIEEPQNEPKNETKENESDSKEKVENSQNENSQNEHSTRISSPNDTEEASSYLSVATESFRISKEELMVQEISSSDSDDEEVDEKASKRETLLQQPEFNENIILDILLVLRTCALAVSKISKDFNDILPEDFMTTKTYKISRTGNQKRFSCKDFAPQVFYLLRSYKRITTAEYLQSWSNPHVIQEHSIHRKGSIILFSPDNKFIIKTISQSESKHLRYVMEDYYKYLISQPNTLLEKILGHHRVSNKGKKFYLLVLSNSFHPNLNPHEVYSLRGITSSRGTGTFRGSEKQKKENSSSYLELKVNKKNPALREPEFLANRKNIFIPGKIREALLLQI